MELYTPVTNAQEMEPKKYVIIETEPDIFEAVETKDFNTRMNTLQVEGKKPKQVSLELNEDMAREFLQNRPRPQGR